MARALTAAQCLLLTVNLASQGNVPALRSFTPSRLDALAPELVLRVLLTYLPESLAPQEYVTYVSEVASRLYLDVSGQDVEFDVSPAHNVPPADAEHQANKLYLLDLTPPNFPLHAPQDALTRFLCHRAYRIDEETGLLGVVLQLVEPFLDRNEYIRTWYVSGVLPLMRLQNEYYPEGNAHMDMPLREFERIDGSAGIDFLLQSARVHHTSMAPSRSRDMHTGRLGKSIARDVRGLVGPWTYGHTQRKRRKLDSEPHSNAWIRNADATVEDLNQGARKIALSGPTEYDGTGHDWEHLYRWMVTYARDTFSLVTELVENWDGPSDVDLGGVETDPRSCLDETTQKNVELRYAQAAFAACYAVEVDTQQTISGAHTILARLAELLDYIPPPDLATSVDSLPKVERHQTKLDTSQSLLDLEPDALLAEGHPLTTPRLDTYMLLQMMVYSAYQFSSLGHAVSLASVAKLHFYATDLEQEQLLRKILAGLGNSGDRKDASQWAADRAKLLWLWNWGIVSDHENPRTGEGVLGKIDKETFEAEMLRVFTETSSFEFAIQIYLNGNGDAPRLLGRDRIEDVVMSVAMEAYDGASNCNRTRGGVKRASDIITAFRSYFPQSRRFLEANALIAATHALSFYSLALQHGVPFRPVSIRASKDPIGLVEQVLEQNLRSHTKLDDLIDIGRNLVAAGLAEQHECQDEHTDWQDLHNARRRQTVAEVERRVTFMAISAALREDDFETAYSYILTRLSPSHTSPNHVIGGDGQGDDISWRAAFLAGRYRGSAPSSPHSMRRLEQRTELLSLALLLAPASALPEILTSWRRCEEEMRSLQLTQQAEEEAFDDAADRRAAPPGGFRAADPGVVLGQKRREMGRWASGSSGGAGRESEGAAAAPVSMFDLTRSAARALGRNAFPLHSASTSSAATASAGGDAVHEAGAGGEFAERMPPSQQRIRKRDLVANAVSGSLATGIGWVLGAAPVDREKEQL